MNFGEKLYKLRKEKGWSQEELAEQVNTTRQAISKWENNQGFPETEKLLMISNLFEVSVDSLLKENAETNKGNDNGYYISKEMAEGYLLYEQKCAKRISFGFSALVLSTLPWLCLRQWTTEVLMSTGVIALIGIAFVFSAMMLEDRYQPIRQEHLIFDSLVFKDLKNRYQLKKKKLNLVLLLGLCMIVIGFIFFLVMDKELIEINQLMNFAPLCIVITALGVVLFFRAASLLEAWEILVKNEEHTRRFWFRLTRKIKTKMNHWLQ